jgi:hypothetical protein
MENEVLRTLVPCGTNLFICDTIRHKGMLWLVPAWSEAIGEGWRRPKLAILLEFLPYQRVENEPNYHYLLLNTIPMSVLMGQSRYEQGVRYEVLEAPDIRVSMPARH